MTQDDFLLDEIERTQLQRTRRRRGQRSRQRRLLGAIALTLGGLLILGLPSLISHTPVANNLLARVARAYGFDAQANEIQLGWFTPLKLTDLRLSGLQSGSEVTVASLATELTVTDLISGSTSSFGSISLRHVELTTDLVDGQLAIERDLAAWLAEESAGATTGRVSIREFVCRARDSRGGVWQLDQFAGDLKLKPHETEINFSGLLSDPTSNGGAMEGHLQLASGADALWSLQLQCDSVPLSMLSIARRYAESWPEKFPSELAGDLSGSATLRRTEENVTEVGLHGVQLKNLTATDPSRPDHVWRNDLATMDGDLLVLEDEVVGTRLQVTTDFAELMFDGAFSRQMSLAGPQDNPFRWLDSLQGTATASLDLASLDQSLPGLIPLRDGVRLISGRVHARAESVAESETRRARLAVHSDAVHARARSGAVVIEPMDVTATIRNEGGGIVAEQFRCESSFASAIGQGDLRSGTADLQINFGRLSAMLRPLVKMSSASLGGAVEGNIAWSVTADNRWTLDGQGMADDLLLAIGDGKTVRRPKLHGSVKADGHWGNSTLEELTSAAVTINGSGIDFSVELGRPVVRPSSRTPFPLQITGEGRLEEFVATLRPWLPEAFAGLTGGLAFEATADVSAIATRIIAASARLTDPSLHYGDSVFRQPYTRVKFDGEYGLPANQLVCRSLTVEADAFTAAVQGSLHGDAADLEIDWRAALDRLQSSSSPRIASNPGGSIQPASLRPDGHRQDNAWGLRGVCNGNLVIHRRGDKAAIETRFTANDFAVLQPSAEATRRFVGPVRQIASRGGGPVALGQPRYAPGYGSRAVWAEPEVRVNGKLDLDLASEAVSTKSLQVSSDWLATTVQGRGSWTDGQQTLVLSGPAKIKMNEVANRLTPLCGTELRAAGIHDTELDIRVQRDAGDPISFDARGTLGWEAAAIAGINFGATSLPIAMTESRVVVDPPAVVPVGEGRLHVGGEVHYRPGPLWLQAKPGRIAESVRLTPEMTNRWLKYVAPLAADATQISGAFSASIDEAIIVFDDLSRSRVIGKLELGGVEMVSGPLTNRVIRGVEQLRAFRSLADPGPSRTTDTKLVSLLPQTVEFSLRDNVVNHRRLELAVDRARVITEGNVSLDGRLDLVAQVPLDPRWLGRDLQMLAGTAISIPISGTFERPTLDPSAVRTAAEQLGSRAIQGATESFLQEQLDKGQQQINRGIEKGMERLGLEKVFGF